MRQRNLFAPEPVCTPKPDSDLIVRPYQLDVADRASDKLKERGIRRIIIQGETGSGKRYTSSFIAKRAIDKNKRVLLLADQRKLVKQHSETMDTFGVPHGVIMAGDTRSTYQPCILASVQTLYAWNKRKMEMPPPFDLILIDECHGCEAKTFQTLLQMWERAYAIGFTATPIGPNGEPLKGYFQDIVCMVPASQLIAEGWLIKPEVYVPKEIALKRKQGKKVDKLAGDPVSHWLRHAEGMPTVLFASSIRGKGGSLDLRDRFLSNGITAEHLDGTSKDGEREDVFNRVQCGETKIMCTVDLAIEGVDIPELSCAILYRKFGSFRAFRQGCGRIMRPCLSIGKTRAIVLDHAGACGQHGSPGEDIQWSLGSTALEWRINAIEEGKIIQQICCTGCGFMFDPGPICPSCSKEAPKIKSTRSIAEKVRDELLAPMKEEETDEEYQTRRYELLQRIWVRCIYQAIGMGRKVSTVVAMFKKSTGKWPNEAGIKNPPHRSVYDRMAEDYFASYARKR
jgi:superfamily II DNA or RNA helicase